MDGRIERRTEGQTYGRTDMDKTISTAIGGAFKFHETSMRSYLVMLILLILSQFKSNNSCITTASIVKHTHRHTSVPYSNTYLLTGS